MRTQFFRVDGADRETGQETFLVLKADTKPQAEQIARRQGLLIASVRIAKAADWESLGTPTPDSEAPAEAEPRAEPAPEAEYLPEPAGDIESAPPADFEPIAEPDPSAYSDSPVTPPDLIVEPEAVIESTVVNEPPASPGVQLPDRAALSTPEAPPTAPAGARSAAVVLSCVAAALLIGGVLALTLALWPDTGVRNELQQIDFRLHEVSQTILGGALVIGGLVVFAIAAVYAQARRR